MKKLCLLLFLTSSLAFCLDGSPLDDLNKFYDLKKNQREASPFVVSPVTGTYVLRPAPSLIITVPRPSPTPRTYMP